jgi:hypothetical protein
MSLPKTEQTPDDPMNLPPARRRRAQRLLVPLNLDERESFLDDIAHRTTPSCDFFLFSLFAGLALGLGLWVDTPALLVLGALLAPSMTPLIGISLGTISGSASYFGRSLLSLIIASSFGFLTSLGIGFATTFWAAPKITQAYYHTQIAWYHFMVVGIATVLTTIAIVRKRHRVAVASVALAYELYVPLAVAGFGLSSGVPDLWPDGLVVYAIHLAWAASVGTLTLLVMGFRPLTLFGSTAGGVLSLAGIILVIGVIAAGAAVGGQVALPTPSPTLSLTPTDTLTPSMTPTITNTPIPPTVTLPATWTPSLTLTPSETPIPSPTPIYALVTAPEDYGGAIIRREPGYGSLSITSALNGTLIIILDDQPVLVEDTPWLNVRLPNGTEGWMLESAITIATPVPNW